MSQSDFKNLIVWRRALDVAADAYRTTASFPLGERYGLTAQIRRAAVSISANIAESCGRPGFRDQARCLGIAVGSARETESHLYVAEALGYVRRSEIAELLRNVDDVERMLAGLIRRKKQMGQPL